MGSRSPCTTPDVVQSCAVSTLFGRRVLLRPLETSDFPKWQEVRRRNSDWLTKWEPERLPGSPDVVEDAQAFSVRCSARQRERQLGTGYGFGIFIDGVFGGEINLNSIQRGPFQSCYVGYWIDEALAGNSYVPEAFVVATRFAFDELHLHRVQAAIVPRNTPSRRVADQAPVAKVSRRPCVWVMRARRWRVCKRRYSRVRVCVDGVSSIVWMCCGPGGVLMVMREITREMWVIDTHNARPRARVRSECCVPL